jgi:hypothetical protein
MRNAQWLVSNGSVGRRLFRLLRGAAKAEGAGKLGQAGGRGDDADARHRAPHERVRQPGGHGRNLSEEVPLPESRPRRDDQDQARFEKVSRENETGERGDGQPSVSTLDKRVTRSATSR